MTKVSPAWTDPSEDGEEEEEELRCRHEQWMIREAVCRDDSKYTTQTYTHMWT